MVVPPLAFMFFTSMKRNDGKYYGKHGRRHKNSAGSPSRCRYTNKYTTPYHTFPLPLKMVECEIFAWIYPLCICLMRSCVMCDRIFSRWFFTSTFNFFQLEQKKAFLTHSKPNDKRVIAYYTDLQT